MYYVMVLIHKTLFVGFTKLHFDYEDDSSLCLDCQNSTKLNKLIIVYIFIVQQHIKLCKCHSSYCQDVCLYVENILLGSIAESGSTYCDTLL